ncbi:SDR family oxidoreductase [Tardiphaga robiniae]|uniref:NmrA family transcriptional regulator n=1 Tax=Tardiphaga robiniae TaxID=943830 RepID=A0A164AEL4_9BRAD|nr:SDR family oxidoreductase [Tardiphaga robiniae]KZD24687.1 NmrA family transcriptional regulator [Tardiphaga robiniae]
MKIVVIGGSGLIGTQVVSGLSKLGHKVFAASPSTGVNALTREGLAEAMSGTNVVIDVANSPSFEDGPVMDFFQTSSRNLLAAEKAAGVQHHLALSVVGSERLQASGYFRAKLAQEDLIKASGMPYTILRATQFFEFIPAIVQGGTDGDVIRLAPALIQPIASADVAAAMVDLAVEAPVNGIVEVAGPEPLPLDALGRKYLTAKQDPRQVIADIHVGYFGTPVDDRSLTPDAGARIGAIRLDDWLKR